MTVQTVSQYPEFCEQLEALVEQHLELDDEPLLLAIYYKPDRDEGDVFLFEVIEDFGNGAIGPDDELFEVTIASTSGFLMAPEQWLHLVLTNPHEFEVAVRQEWEHVEELRRAVNAGNYKLLHRNAEGEQLGELIGV